MNVKTKERLNDLRHEMESLENHLERVNPGSPHARELEKKIRDITKKILNLQKALNE